MECEEGGGGRGAGEEGFKWTEEAQLAFEKIKTTMCKALVLKISDFTKPFFVECDASHKCIGVVLLQEAKTSSLL